MSVPTRSRVSVCSQPGCPALVAGGGRCGGTCCAGRCKAKTPDRGTVTEQGYGAAWRRVRAPFIAANLVCVGVDGQHAVNCDGRATVPDHDPLTRRELVARGDPNPDAWHHLRPLSGPCHSRKTALYDGAFGNRAKVRGRD